MKKISVALNIAALVVGLSALPSHAQFGGLGGLLGGSKTSAAPVDVDSYLKSVSIAEQLMENSLNLLHNAIVSKKSAADLEAEKKANANKSNSNENDAKSLEARKTQTAALNEAAKNGELEKNIDNMDAATKKSVGLSAFNFALALLKDKALLDESKSMITSLASNPANLSKVGQLKDAASSLSNQLAMASDLGTLMPKIMTKVGVKEFPKSASEDSKQVGF